MSSLQRMFKKYLYLHSEGNIKESLFTQNTLITPSSSAIWKILLIDATRRDAKITWWYVVYALYKMVISKSHSLRTIFRLNWRRIHRPKKAYISSSDVILQTRFYHLGCASSIDGKIRGLFDWFSAWWSRLPYRRWWIRIPYITVFWTVKSIDLFLQQHW